MPLIVRFENPLGKKLGNDYHYKINMPPIVRFFVKLHPIMLKHSEFLSEPSGN